MGSQEGIMLLTTCRSAVHAPARNHVQASQALSGLHAACRLSCHCCSMAGLVETSTNLAAVQSSAPSPETPHIHYTITCSTRSSLGPALEAVRIRISKIAHLCGAAIEQDVAYPGWKPSPSSDVVQLAKEVIGDLIGHEPKVRTRSIQPEHAWQSPLCKKPRDWQCVQELPSATVVRCLVMVTGSMHRAHTTIHHACMLAQPDQARSDGPT